MTTFDSTITLIKQRDQWGRPEFLSHRIQWTSLAQITDRCAYLNGRARDRKATIGMFAQAVFEATEYGIGHTNAGLIRCNSYNYRADARAVAAIKIRGRIYVASAVINAKGSPVTWFGPSADRANAIDKWRKSQTVATLDHSWVLLSPALVRALLAFRLDFSAQDLGDLADTVISRHDSLASGNCERITSIVAKFFGDVPQQAKVVLAAFPEYRAYIRRAARFAQLAQN